MIPSKDNEDRSAQPVEFDREAYRRRNIVERAQGKPPHHLVVREDGQKFRRRDHSGLHPTVPEFSTCITVLRQSLVPASLLPAIRARSLR